MPGRRRIKRYVASACVVAAAALSGGVALAQSQSGPSLHSSTTGSGPGTVSGPSGQFVPGNASTPPTAPAGSTTYSSRESGSGKVTKSYRAAPKASVRHSAAAAGPSLHSSDSGSGPGTVNGPNGQFVPGNGAAPPTPPAGSTSYSSKASGPGQTVKSYPGG